MGLFSLSSHAQTDSSTGKDGKTKIQLDGLSDTHPNKKHMEWFLNNYEEAFIESDVAWKALEHQNLIQKGYHFRTKASNISVILIFCKHQNDALIIAEANYPVVKGGQIAGVNGGVLFVVEGSDQYEVNEVLSWFAVEE